MSFVAIADQVRLPNTMAARVAARPDVGRAGRLHLRSGRRPGRTPRLGSSHARTHHDRLGPRGLHRLAARRTRSRDHAARRRRRRRRAQGRRRPVHRPGARLHRAWRPRNVRRRCSSWTAPAGCRPTPTASPTCIGPLVEKMQSRKGAPGPVDGGGRLQGHRHGGRRPAGLHVLEGARPVRPVLLRTRSRRQHPVDRAAAAGRPQHRARRERARAWTAPTSGSGCACTRRPTGCSSPPCPGCATTSRARSTR